MNVLFFFVHPAKFHVFRPVIERLKAENHKVDIAIIAKDVLPQLVDKAGWEYVNIFPEGRRAKHGSKLKLILGTLCNFLKTVYRLWKYTARQKNKYDLFVTDDCLSIVGKLKGVPTLFFLDDDISVVPEISPLLKCSHKIFAPEVTDVGKFDGKKVAFRGYKEACYLLPQYFTPDPAIPEKYNLHPGKYVFIRLVALTATHDFGKNGISDQALEKLIAAVEARGFQVVLSMERNISEKFRKYRFTGTPDETIHILAHSALFFGDSQTMTSEAVMLGVPAIRCNDFVGRISVMDEKEYKYDMTYGFLPADFESALQKTVELLDKTDLLLVWQAKRQAMLAQLDDVSDKLYNEISRIVAAQK